MQMNPHLCRRYGLYVRIHSCDEVISSEKEIHGTLLRQSHIDEYLNTLLTSEIFKEHGIQPARLVRFLSYIYVRRESIVYTMYECL